MAGSIFKAKRPEVIILDLAMPGMDGVNVCKHIRKIEGTKRTKIILLIGYPSKDNFMIAKKAGAD